MAGMQVSLCLLAYAAAALMGGSAQITCYTEPSVAGEFNCLASNSNFDAATIEECCVETDGYFFEGGGNESCQACIVFGFFNGLEITLPEQGEATTLAIGFIKGGNVQPLTGIDRRNTARFSITVAGNATEGPNADFTIQTTSFEIEGPDAREPFQLTTAVLIDGVTLETAEDFILTLEGLNEAGRVIIAPTFPGQFVDPTIRVVIEDVESTMLQFTESDYSNVESVLVIVPAVQLTTNIATDLTVRVVPVNITEALTRDLPSIFPTIPPFDSRAPNIATSGADFSTTPLEFTFPAGSARTIRLDSGIGIIDDDINEVEQIFALILEVVDAIDPGRVDLQSERFASIARIFDDDPINIGFEQERYTVFEAVAASGELILIPIIKENGQESELTFEVIATLTLGSGPTAAQPGEDFEANPPIQRQDFDADEQDVLYLFELIDDGVPEPTETFQIQLSLADEGLTNINLGASGGGSLFATATIVIIDDDEVIIGWEQNVTRVNEIGMLLELCVSVLNLDDTVEFSGGFEVNLAANTIRGTAADPDDYSALLADKDIFFDLIDDVTRRTCIEVEIIDDNVLEGVQFFSIEVAPDPFVTNFPSNVLLDPVVTFVEILDNDFVRIGFNQTNYTALESDRVATVYVAVEGDLQRNVSVTLSTNASSATADADFDSLTRQLTFDINTRVIPVNITIIDDDIFEELPETFTVSLTPDPADPVDEVIVSFVPANVSIRDVGLINFRNSVYSVGEAEVNLSVQLLLSFDEGFNLTSQSFEVSFITVNVTAQGDRDYEAVFTNITINSTMTSISISVINDQAVEANETFQCQITLISPTPNVVITQTEAVVVIVDDDNVTIQFQELEHSVMEGGQLSLGVQIIGENEIPLTVPFTIGGSATFQEDFTFTSENNQNITIEIEPTIAIDPITTRCLLLNLSIVDDNIALEGTESILFELSDKEPQVQLGEPSTTTVLITDGDEIRVSLVEVPCEGFENENLNVSVSRSGASIASNLTMNITIELLSEMNVTDRCSSQPSDSTDFNGLKIAVTFVPNDKTNDTSSCILPIIDDDINEPEEIFFLSLQLETNRTAGITLQNRMLVCTLQDDDEISIHFGNETYTFQESAVSPVISLVANRPSQQDFFVAIGPERGRNSILNVTNAELISFRPEQGNNNSMTINIEIANDNARGSDLSQNLRLQRRLESPPFANCAGFLQTCSNTTIHITDDDRVIIGFENTSRRVSLDNVGEIQICVSVMPNSIGNDVENFFLQVETSDHSAKPGTDYSIDPSSDCVDNALVSGNNNSFLLGHFNHTRQRCCFNISIVDDDNQEELVIELNITLSQAEASSLLPIDIIPDVITVVIIDDDECMVATTELEGASVCYNPSTNCSGSCIIFSTAEECCSRNGTSLHLLGNDTCLDTMQICESPTPSQTPPVPTNPSSSSDQSIVIIASVVAAIGFILLVVVTIMIVLVVCLRRAQKTVNLNRKGEVDTLTHGYDGTLPVASAEFMQTLPRSLIISASQLHLKDTLGQGEFGIVYKAFFKRYMNSETEIVAVKTLKGLFTSRDVHGLAEEVLKMQAFRHRHVMSLIGVCLDSGAGPAIVMPYMANGSLLDYLRKERDSLLLDENASSNKVSETQKFLLNVCLQVAEGMEYLAQEKVVHRDLSARNCMIDGEGIIKVADFGLSEDIYSTNYYRQGKEDEMKLPIRWMAVESIMDGIYTEKSDVWSFGVTMWEVYSGGMLPYPGVTSSELIRNVASGGRLSKPENTACSDEVYSCMQQCWLEAADKRPNFHDLVTTISNILESIAGYLDLQRSVSLIKRVKQDYSRSPRPKRPNSEMPILEEEQLEGKEEAEKEAERDSECRGGEEEKEEQNEANTKTICGGAMGSAKYETTETAI